MKRKFITVLTLLMVGLTVWAWPSIKTTSISLAWDPSPDATVTGYKIYYGVSPRVYTNWVTVGNVTNTTINTNFTRGVVYYFTATAFDSTGLESDFCNEVSYRWGIIPAPPGNVVIPPGNPGTTK